jgi:hypothetical protein
MLNQFNQRNSLCGRMKMRTKSNNNKRNLSIKKSKYNRNRLLRSSYTMILSRR